MRMRAIAMDLRVRLLPEPCLWCWEIVERRRGGTLVQSSWATEWMAYESREEALAAGHGRLSELLPCCAEGASPSRDCHRHGDGAMRAEGAHRRLEGTGQAMRKEA
jgi:hypothetical protein